MTATPTASATAASIASRNASGPSPASPKARPQARKPTTPSGIRNAAYASQSICNRSIPRERLYRVRAPAAPKKRLANTESHTGSLRKPSASGSRSGKGFVTSANGGSSFGDMRTSATSSVLDASAKAANGRQRREGSGPSGKTSAIASGQAKKNGHWDATSAAHAPPRSDPPDGSSATSAYDCPVSTA